MKYARLSHADLKDLEKEFIEFLVVNGIEAKEWEQLKKTDMTKVEKIIDQFSDVVWESILRKNNLVEKRERKRIIILYVLEKELYTLTISSDDDQTNFNKKEQIDELKDKIDHYATELINEKIESNPQEVLFSYIQKGFYLSRNNDYISLIKKMKMQ